MKKQRILFIGAGRMAKAIFSGLVNHKKEHIDEIIISNRQNSQRLAEMRDQFGVIIADQWRNHVPYVDVVILAIPPQEHLELLQDLSKVIKGQFVITVAAGVGVGLLEKNLPPQTPVAWVMPNTAADIGESISLYTYGSSVTDDHRAVLEMILDGIGEFEECTEQQIHELTAITGSAPAFIYQLTEIFEGIAVEYGVSHEQARKLVVQMLYGSVSMLKTGESPGELRNQVTSPGGSTAAGLQALDEEGFANILKNAVAATYARAQELAKG